MNEIRVPKFANVIKYLNEACNKSLLTLENVCSGTTDFNLEENYFRYKNVSIEYHTFIVVIVLILLKEEIAIIEILLI